MRGRGKHQGTPLQQAIGEDRAGQAVLHAAERAEDTMRGMRARGFDPKAPRLPNGRPRPSNPDATTPTTTREDPEDGFIRTALIVANDADPKHGETGSVDLVRIVKGKVVRVAQVNVSYLPNSDGEECLIVDVIDVDDRYTERRMLSFSPSERKAEDVPKGGNLVSTDFRRKL
jgi:hypothetical protein